MPDPEITKDQTGTITTRTRWAAIELTRVGAEGLRLGIPAFTVTTLPDGTKVRQPIAGIDCLATQLAHDPEAQQFLDLADRLAKRLLRGDLKPQALP